MRCENCKALERRLLEREGELEKVKEKLLRTLAKMENMKHRVISAANTMGE